MSKFRKRSLNRYGLAMLIIGGAGIVAGTSRSGAEVSFPKIHNECWLDLVQTCNMTYFPPCDEKPDGSSRVRCPY